MYPYTFVSCNIILDKLISKFIRLKKVMKMERSTKLYGSYAVYQKCEYEDICLALVLCLCDAELLVSEEPESRYYIAVDNYIENIGA